MRLINVSRIVSLYLIEKVELFVLFCTDTGCAAKVRMLLNALAKHNSLLNALMKQTKRILNFLLWQKNLLIAHLKQINFTERTFEANKFY